MACGLHLFYAMFRAPLTISTTLAIALAAALPARAQDGGALGTTDAAITPPRNTAAAAPAENTAIRAAEKLPAESPGLPASAAPAAANLRPRGAATLAATATLDSGRLTLEVIGAAKGYYRVRLLNTEQCPASPPPPEMTTGEVDEARRSRPAPATAAAPGGLVLGEVRIGDDGRGKFMLPLGKNDLPKDTRNISVLLEERPGTVNPSAADLNGLVACGAMVLPAENAG